MVHLDMDRTREFSISAALIVLICFFLPWVQVSCGGSKETLTGVGLAQDGHHGLWLIPPLMLMVLFLGTWRKLRDRRELSALASLLAGVISAYLMNRERSRAEDNSDLLAVQVTGWLWLGLGASILLAAIGAFQLLKRRQSSET
jgi:hypothetical protein